MSAAGLSVANTDYDAAQALLDLQSNIRDVKTELYQGNLPLGRSKETVDTAKLFLNCFISSNVSKTQNKPMSSPIVGTVSPMYAVTKNLSVKSETATSMQTSPEELTRTAQTDSYSKESSNKRSKIFKRKPIKYFTVTAGPMPDILANKIHKSTYKDNTNYSARTKIKTRDVGTQTEDKYTLPIIETMEFTISQLCEKIKSLEAQIQSNSQHIETVNHSISDTDNKYEENDDDDSYKPNSIDMTMEDSSAFDSDMDESFTDRETPKKVKSKHKTARYHEYDTTKVLSNRNLNANADDMVPIGDGNALIPSRILRHINWNSYTSATRKLLTAVFSRRILATHSLTGKPSPAFPNKPAKKKLDPALVNDIVQTVVEKCSVPENVVRTSITTKCADESKMFRTREKNKKKRTHKVNRENIPPDSDSDQF